MPRKPKTIDPPAKTELFARTNRRRLDTVGAICSEQGKIYRAAASGAIPTDEAMRLSMILRELRAALEAAKEAATITLPAPGTLGPVTIYSIPRGCLFDQVSGRVTGPNGELDPPLQEIQPYEGSAPLTMLTAPIDTTPLEVMQSEAENVASLNAYRRSREEPPGPV